MLYFLIKDADNDMFSEKKAEKKKPSSSAPSSSGGGGGLFDNEEEEDDLFSSAAPKTTTEKPKKKGKKIWKLEYGLLFLFPCTSTCNHSVYLFQFNFVLIISFNFYFQS